MYEVLYKGPKDRATKRGGPPFSDKAAAIIFAHDLHRRMSAHTQTWVRSNRGEEVVRFGVPRGAWFGDYRVVVIPANPGHPPREYSKIPSARVAEDLRAALAARAKRHGWEWDVIVEDERGRKVASYGKKANMSSRTPWAGTYAIERQWHAIQPGLASIYLDGVDGISPKRGHHQVPLADAERLLAKGRDTLAWLKSQNNAPTAKARRWMEEQIRSLSRLLDQAEAVRAGAPQRMTESDYAKLRQR